MSFNDTFEKIKADNLLLIDSKWIITEPLLWMYSIDTFIYMYMHNAQIVHISFITVYIVSSSNKKLF